MKQIVTKFKSKLSQDKKYRGKRIKLGLLKGKASFKIHKDFKMTDEEFLAS